MKSTSQVYKVGMTFNEIIQSVNQNHKYVLEYSIGKKTVPKIGKIFVFKNLETAKRFAEANQILLWDTRNIGSSFVIMKAEAENTFYPARICAMSSQIETWSKLTSQQLHYLSASDLILRLPPPGTLCADSITPTEIISYIDRNGNETIVNEK